MRRRYAYAAAALALAVIGLTAPTFGQRSDAGPIGDYLHELATVSLPQLPPGDELRPGLERLAEAGSSCDDLLPALDELGPAVERVQARLTSADTFLGPLTTQLTVQAVAARERCGVSG